MTKKIIPFEINLKSSQRAGFTFQPRPQILTNDANSAELNFIITDANSGELTGATATVLLFMKDGSFFQNTDVTRVNNTFVYIIKPNQAKHKGVAQAQLVVKQGTVENASPLMEFEIVGGLETKPIVEREIQDWTSLTAEAKAFVEQIEGFTLESFVENKMGQELANLEVNYAGRLTGLESADQTITAQLEDTAHIFVNNYKLSNETTYDNAITRAIADNPLSSVLQLTFPRGKVYLNAVRTRRARLKIRAEGTIFVPTNNQIFMWTHSGDDFEVSGCVVEGEGVDNWRGFKVLNDSETKLSSYARFNNLKMYDLYQGIHFDMLGGIGGACYRHTLNNVFIRNFTNPKVRVGSFGLCFSGESAGDAAGNDTKLIDCYVKGYEKNVIIKNSVGPKIMMGSLDGGGIAIELDSTSFLTVFQTYIEYNTTVIKAVNAPYRPQFVGTTAANYTTLIEGELYGGEELLELSASSPTITRMKRTFKGSQFSLSRAVSGSGAGFFDDIRKKSYDFFYTSSKHALIPSEDIDLYHSIEPNFKHYFGAVNGSEFSSIDARGFIQTKQISPIAGVKTFVDGDTSPAIDSSMVFKTDNSTETTISRFDSGVDGMKFSLIIMDNNTTIAHGSNIILKNKASKKYISGETLEFVCLSALTPSTSIYYEI